MKHSKKNSKKNNQKNSKKKFLKGLKRTLTKNFGWKKSMASIVATLVCGLISVGGVWHKKLAQSMNSENQVESDIRKIQRFFCKAYINYHFFSLMLFQMMDFRRKVTIILDRTNWDYGKSHINIFVAAAIYKYPGLSQSFAVPLVWEVFNKKGNSHTQERKLLMQKLLDIVGKNNIEMILADREFIGNEWMQFLDENKIPYIIRIKQNMYVEYKGKRIQVLTLCSTVSYRRKLKFNVVIDGLEVQLCATRSIEGELVIVAASMDIADDPLDQYRLRWLIELFFKSIKSKGFNLEETHMTDPERIKTLFSLIALTTLLTVQAGIVRHHFKKIPIKNHGRPTFSLFTYGLDFLRALFRGTIPHFSTEFYPLLFSPPNENFLFLPEKEKSVYSLDMG